MDVTGLKCADLVDAMGRMHRHRCHILDLDGFTISPAGGTTVTRPVSDEGDGSYSVPISWDPGSGKGPGVIVEQPGRGRS